MAKPIFIAGDMSQNFRALLLYYGLLSSVDATDEELSVAETRVKELIPSFTMTASGKTSVVVEVGKGSSKSALFLLFLAEGRKKFLRSTTDRQLAEQFFTSEVISDAKNKRKKNHPVVRALLADGSLTIEVGEPVEEEVQEEVMEEVVPPVEKKKKPKKEKNKKKGKKKGKNKKKNKK